MATVLIRDDNPDVRGMVKELMVRAGHDVMEANNGKDGLDLLNNKPADVIT